MVGDRNLCLVATLVAAAFSAGCRDRADPEMGDPPPAAENDHAVPGPPVVTISPRAAEEIARHLAELREHGTLYLRVRVVPGGCQGHIHKIDLDPAVSVDDQVFTSAGVRVVIARRQAELLRGTLVDFGEKDGKRGFTVENPNFKGESAAKSLAELAGEANTR